MLPTNKAQAAIQKIIDNLQDRRGLGDEWDLITVQTKREIKDQWVKILLKEFEDA
jgi:hypothetical protein